MLATCRVAHGKTELSTVLLVYHLRRVLKLSITGDYNTSFHLSRLLYFDYDKDIMVYAQNLFVTSSEQRPK